MMPPRPRRRPRKRDTRMDAALDAMRPYGFSSNLVLRTVQELLNVYSEEGWFFIEEASYKVLIETILEKVEEEEADEKSDSSQGNASNDCNTSAAGPQSEIAPACSYVQPVNTVLPLTNEPVDRGSWTNEALDSASHSSEVHDTTSLNDIEPGQTIEFEPVCTRPVDRMLCLPPPAEEQGTRQKDIQFEHNIQKRRTDTSAEKNNDAASGDAEHRGSALIHSPPFMINSPLPMHAFPPRKRRPCHGWISIDDEEVEEENLVELTPAPLPENVRRLLDSLDGLHKLEKLRKRKSRWDLRPEGN